MIHGSGYGNVLACDYVTVGDGRGDQNAPEDDGHVHRVFRAQLGLGAGFGEDVLVSG